MQKPFVVAIEGNIGAGKTSLIEKLQKESTRNCTFLCEPVEEWRKVGNYNILKLFYEEPDMYDFKFESLVLTTMLERDTKPVDTEFVVQERSLISSQMFAKDLCVVDLNIFKKMFDCLKYTNYRKPDLIIYIQTPPEVCMQRILARNRSEEAEINRNTITKLHQRHEEWLNNGTGKDSILNIPVMLVTENMNINKLF